MAPVKRSIPSTALRIRPQTALFPPLARVPEQLLIKTDNYQKTGKKESTYTLNGMRANLVETSPPNYDTRKYLNHTGHAKPSLAKCHAPQTTFCFNQP